MKPVGISVVNFDTPPQATDNTSFDSFMYIIAIDRHSEVSVSLTRHAIILKHS
jgi:hypothetical protein